MKRIVLLALSSLASCGWSPAFAGAPLIRPRAKSPVLVPLVKPLAVRAALFSLRPDQIDYKPAPPSGGGLTPGASPVGSATNCLLYADGSSVLQCAATEAGYDGTIVLGDKVGLRDSSGSDTFRFAAGNHLASREMTVTVNVANIDLDFGAQGIQLTAGAGTGFAYRRSTTTQINYDASSRLAIPSAATFVWSSTSDAASGSYDTGLARNAAGVIRASAGGAEIRGFLGGGAAVASAAALPVPTGRVFHVTGTTNVTSITSTNFAAGAVITLIFDDVLTFTDGNNLVLAGNFVTTTSDVITLVYDGTNWYETSRSVN
jgi:hypothetical protein